VESCVFEARPVLGGLLRTEQIEGCTVEGGADSWLAAKPWARDLAAEVGLAGEVLGSNDALRKTWISRAGKLLPYPDGMQLVAPSRLTPILRSQLFGFGTKMRMIADWFRLPGANRPDESVAQFVRRHFGQEAVNYLAEPLLTGIYGGDPEVLSARSVLPRLVERERAQGSLIRGLHPAAITGSVFESMRGGLGQLVEALRPERVLHATVQALEREGEGFRLRVNGDWFAASQVILACEAHRSGQLVHPTLGELLAGIRHSSGHIVAMGFRGLARLRGFGFLVPKVEGRNVTAATWVSTKFSGRAPEGMQLIRAFYRETSPDPVRELRELMGFREDPVFTRAYEWSHSLPQYAVGHEARVAEIEERVKQIPGLHLIGNAYHGVGIPDCVRLAKSTAERL